MKKLSLCLFVSLLVLASVMASSPVNQQKIYPVDSPLFEALTQLYISEGFSLPSTTGPYSANELILMLNRLDENSLTKQAKSTYNYIHSILFEEPKIVDFGLGINLEGYYHTDTTNFILPKNWIYTYEDRKPLLDIILETSPSEHFYGYSSLPVTATRFEDADNTVGYITNLYGKQAFTSNIFLLHPFVDGKAGFNRLDFNIPYRAFGAFGGDGWSVQVGREQLSWGPGKSGNFVLGDHLSYHNVGRLTTYAKNFKYTLLTSFFPHPGEYYSTTKQSYGGYVDYRTNQTDVSSGLNMFLGHRLEWRFLQQKVNLTLTETIMYQSENNTIDLRVLSPSAIFHNYYIRANANSLIALELDITPIKHLNLYGQMVIDEFVLPGEYALGQSGSLPDGKGFMVGAQGNYPILDGFLFGSFEWAKTDPYLYLRDEGASYNQAPGEYGINYVVAVREFNQRTIYNEDFLGYKYGGDAIVLNGRVGYKEFGKWYTTANVFYMQHGTKDKWTLWASENLTNGTSTETTPTTDHTGTGNNLDEDANLRDSVENTLVVGVQAGWSILPGLDVFAQADFVKIVNPGNISANATRQDMQITVGVSYKL